jgi:hypothetical protein
MIKLIMMNLLLFCLILLSIGSLINKVIRASRVKNESSDFDISANDAKIEVGFPLRNSSTLHINSTKEPPISNHKFRDDNLSILFQGSDNIQNENIYTVNMFVESHYELNLSLFGKDLTKKMVNDAYEKVLNEHMKNIKNGIPEVFNIGNKKKARDYIIEKLKL